MCKTDACEREAAVRGLCRRCYMRARRSGIEKKHEWGKRKYDGQHAYLKANRGPAKNYKCDACGEQAHEWAFIKKWCPDDELLSEIRQGDEIHYSLNASHYVPMCRQHHRAIDSHIRFFNAVEKYV